MIKIMHITLWNMDRLFSTFTQLFFLLKQATNGHCMLTTRTEFISMWFPFLGTCAAIIYNRTDLMESRLFSTCLLRLFQNESSRKTFLMKMCSIYKKMKLQLNRIFMTMVSLEDSFSHRSRNGYF